VPAAIAGQRLSKGLLIRSNVQAVLLVTGDIRINGTMKESTSNGRHLQALYEGENTTVAGRGVVNQGGRATNFFYWGMTNTRA